METLASQQIQGGEELKSGAREINQSTKECTLITVERISKLGKKITNKIWSQLCNEMQVVTVTRTNLKLDTKAKGQKRGIQLDPPHFDRCCF